MHIGHVPRERPPFAALNFRSRSISFSPKKKWQKKKKKKKIAPEHHHFTFVLPLRRPSFSKFLYRKRNFKPFITAAHGRPTAASPNAKRSGQRSGVSGRPECQPDASYSQFRRPRPLSRSSSLRSPAIFMPELAPEPPCFTLPRHIPTNIWGESPPPSPSGCATAA